MQCSPHLAAVAHHIWLSQPADPSPILHLLLHLQLFADSVPSVPVSTSSGSHGISVPAVGYPAAGGGFDESTLDESIWQTLKRDVLTIGRNLRSVLIPVNWDFQNHQAALHNWDLWGPLVSINLSKRDCLRSMSMAVCLYSRMAQKLVSAALAGAPETASAQLDHSEA